MEYWQYVCGITWHKLLKPDFFFLKDKSVRLLEVDMNFTNQIMEIHLGSELLSSE